MENKKISINKKPTLTREDLNNLPKTDLINRIIQLEAHNKQLKNIIEKFNSEQRGSGLKEGISRKFDFTKAPRRHVLLKFLYFGWDYQGFASQEDTNGTIEFYIFEALKKTCLIENRQNSNYNRCGRTDKEVSAFCQVISIDVRSKFPEPDQANPENLKNELDYCNMLNRILPTNIICVSWMPLNNKCYSARFDCIERTYKYFFPIGNLDINAMRLGCKYLVGTHDLRNLCKMDVANGVVNFVRKIKSAEIKKCETQIHNNSGYDMYYFQITSKAFLWHQIRCIMAVLFLIGEKNEDPSIIAELINVEKNPCKPQYSLANGVPLNLYSCDFNTKGEKVENKLTENSMQSELTDQQDTTEWMVSEENLLKIIESLQSEWSNFSIRTTMIREVISDLEQTYYEKFGVKSVRSQDKVLQQGVRSRQYQKLLSRKRCESLENRLNHYIKKQRLVSKPIVDEEKKEPLFEKS